MIVVCEMVFIEQTNIHNDILYLPIFSTVNGHTNNSPQDIVRTRTDSFYLFCYVMGLGLNICKMEPAVRVKGVKFIYTFEQNSIHYGKWIKKPKEISKGTFE